MRNPLDKKTASDLSKLIVFVLVTTLATGLLVILIGNISFQGTKEYKAVFSDATGVVGGDDVRIAGVKVGTVKSIEVVNGDQAEVVFTVASDTTLSRASEATIKYRNLVGQRYIAVEEGVGSTSTLQPGETIPIGQTQPALDLTVLFNGFKPLFAALSPDDLNKLSFEIISTFQGEGGTVESLLGSTASLTNTLADRDQIIGQLIDNLDTVLDNLADRDQQLSALIINFKDLVTGLADDREAILGSLDDISSLANQTSDLVGDIRAPFVEDIKQLRRTASNIDDNKAELDRALQVLPIKLNKVGRTAIQGSLFNFYLCDIKGTVGLNGLPIPDSPLTEGGRIKLDTETLGALGVSIGGERCNLG